MFLSIMFNCLLNIQVDPRFLSLLASKKKLYMLKLNQS